MSAREKIPEAVLTLFAENGYDGTGVEQIAGIVGIKAQSLYKHYKGKADIFKALIDSAETRYGEMFGPERNIGVSCPGTGQEQQAEEKKQINLRAAKGCT